MSLSNPSKSQTRTPRPETRDPKPETRNPIPDASAFSPQQQRDLDGLVDLLHCPVRRSILRSLATAGKANVKALTARTSIAPNTLSQHLVHLRNAGLVFRQRRGKEIWYEVTEDRVRCEQQGSKLLLTVTAAGGDAEMTITVGLSGRNDRAP